MNRTKRQPHPRDVNSKRLRDLLDQAEAIDLNSADVRQEHFAEGADLACQRAELRPNFMSAGLPR